MDKKIYRSMEMTKLPDSIDDRLSYLTSKFPKVDNKILYRCSQNYNIFFMLDKPVFLFYWIEDGQLRSQNILVYSHSTSSILSFNQPNRLFCVYDITNNIIRGSSIEDKYEMIKKRREDKINIILN